MASRTSQVRRQFMKLYDPALVLLQQAIWAFRNRIISSGTLEEYVWEGRYQHFLSEYIAYETNENALRCSAGQFFIKGPNKNNPSNHTMRMAS
jgi:hypothetical protein